MAYLTKSNSIKIISKIDFKKIKGLEGEIYKKPIYFFSEFEKNKLLGLQKFLKDPENFIQEYYVPIEVVDNLKFVYEGGKPAYHSRPDCERLNSNYKNFEIPDEIKIGGVEKILSFRSWFKKNQYLLEKPDVFVMRLHAAFGVTINPIAIDYENSGVEVKENMNLEELEMKINQFISDAGQYFKNANQEEKEILKQFQKFTYLAYSKKSLQNNNSRFSDETIKVFLKQYDKQFKRPIKDLLIEYYRILYNPQLKFEGDLLKQLGFKPCGHCYNNESISNDDVEKNKVQIGKLDWNYLFEHENFFNQLFSSHYAFTEVELIKYREYLSVGSPFKELDSGAIRCYTVFGLIYNSQVSWTEQLKKLYYKEPQLLYAGGGIDEYSCEIEFDTLPLSINDEFESIKSISLNQILSGYEYSDNEGYYDDLPSDIESSDKYYNEILAKAKFSDFELYEKVENHNFEYIGNEHFYSALIELIKKEMPDFSVINYYNNYENSIQDQYEKYMEAYFLEMEKWNEIEDELGGGSSWNDINESLMSFNQFKAKFTKGGVPGIMRSDGGIINSLE